MNLTEELMDNLDKQIAVEVFKRLNEKTNKAAKTFDLDIEDFIEFAEMYEELDKKEE